ncbi:MAG: zinc ribbon domain-containing protein [Chloroflexota bacterium]|nr:zinc ribbon domain-containing protein [Dehalococcoidia bacterium]MDW8254537.1 zinc ribbon domain-containing protein [Chloroflexota bacterium]
MDSQSPSPLPLAPLLSPSTRCFHCAAELPPGANFCPGCGAVPGLTAETERGYIAYLLAAVDDWLRARLIGPPLADRMTAPYRARLGIAVAAPAPVTPPAAPAPPRQPVNFTVIWANALLYLGAFFVVIASLFFLLLIESNLGRTVVVGVLAGLFFVTGLIARQIAPVRSAGIVFTAVGALLVPIVFLAFINWLRDVGPLSETQLWLFASLACFLLYLAFTLARFGLFYAILTLIAFSSVVQAALAVADPVPEWAASWWAAEALVLMALHVGLRRWLRPLFGPLILGWSLFWAIVAFVAAIPASLWPSDPAPGVWPFVFLTLTFIVMAWGIGDPISPLLAGLLIHVASAQTVRWAEGPEWVGSLASIAIASGQIAFWWLRRGTILGREQLVIGIGVALVALFPPIFAETQGIGAAAGLYVTALLSATAILTRRSWLLAAPALSLLPAWFWLLDALPLDLEGAANAGLGYLVLVVGITALALALPLRLWGWRWMLGGIAAVYALFVALLTVEQAGHSAVAAWSITLLAAAAVARWRVLWLLGGVALALVGAAAATARWLGAPQETGGPLIATLAVGWVLAGHALGDHLGRWGLAARLVGLATGLFAVFVAGAIQGEALEEERRRLAGHLTSFVIFVLALLIGLEVRWRRLALYPASFLALCALLWELGVFEVDNPQWYAVPAGLYFGGVAFLSARDRDLGATAPVLSALAWVIGALVIGLTSLSQTFGEEGLRYGLILLAECFALLGVGAVVRSRALLATTVLLMVLAGLRLLFAEPGFIPFVLFLAGLALLAGGVIVLAVVGWRRARGTSPEEPPGRPPIAGAGPP